MTLTLLDLGGLILHTAYRRASLINLYLHANLTEIEETFCGWNRRTDRRTFETYFIRSTHKSRPNKKYPFNYSTTITSFTITSFRDSMLTSTAGMAAVSELSPMSPQSICQYHTHYIGGNLILFLLNTCFFILFASVITQKGVYTLLLFCYAWQWPFFYQFSGRWRNDDKRNAAYFTVISILNVDIIFIIRGVKVHLSSLDSFRPLARLPFKHRHIAMLRYKVQYRKAILAYTRPTSNTVAPAVHAVHITRVWVKILHPTQHTYTRHTKNNHNTRCSQRQQTLPPVPPPDELDETYMKHRLSCIIFDSGPLLPLW